MVEEAGGAEYRTMARLLAARLAAFDPLEMRAASAARELASMEPERGALVLSSLVDLSRMGGDRERLALEAVGRAILQAPPDQLSARHRSRLFEAAQELALFEVAALFIAPPPVLAVDEAHPPRADPALAHLTLGHKKMLARSANPDLVARLAAEAEPPVVANLLLNPRLTEPVVVRICARRPMRAAVLRAVFDSRRWSTRNAVRRAIVQNPYCEPELALKILPTLDEATLMEIGRNRTLHQALRDAALHLLERRSEPPGEE